MQSLQSGDEKGQRAFAIFDGGIGINLAGMRNEGMTVQRLCLSFLMKRRAEPALKCKQKSYSARKRGRIAFAANGRISEILDFAIQVKLLMPIS